MSAHAKRNRLAFPPTVPFSIPDAFFSIHRPVAARHACVSFPNARCSFPRMRPIFRLFPRLASLVLPPFPQAARYGSLWKVFSPLPPGAAAALHLLLPPSAAIPLKPGPLLLLHRQDASAERLSLPARVRMRRQCLLQRHAALGKPGEHDARQPRRRAVKHRPRIDRDAVRRPRDARLSRPPAALFEHLLRRRFQRRIAVPQPPSRIPPCRRTRQSVWSLPFQRLCSANTPRQSACVPWLCGIRSPLSEVVSPLCGRLSKRAWVFPPLAAQR